MKKDGSIVYFNSGAIGEFLMTLYFADLVCGSAQTQGKPAPMVVVPVRRNAGLLTELARQYAQVKVVSIEAGKALSGFKEIANAKPAIVITQQTFSVLPLQLKLYAYAVARFTGATFAGYRDAAKVNEYLYDTLWQFDSSVLFPKEMSALAERLGYPNTYVEPRLQFPTAEPPFKAPYFIFHVKSFTLSRTLPESRWKVLVQEIRKRHPETLFLFSGSKDDKEMIERIIEGITNCINTAGDLPIGTLIAAIDHAALFVGVDTGITHLAAFRGAPMVILGTNSTPCWWATYNSNATWLVNGKRCACKGDKQGNCQEFVEGSNRFKCLLDISNETVLSEVANKLHA